MTTEAQKKAIARLHATATKFFWAGVLFGIGSVCFLVALLVRMSSGQEGVALFGIAAGLNLLGSIVYFRMATSLRAKLKKLPPLP